MDNELAPSALLRATLAAALLGAAIIHFAMVPQHMAEWAPEGIAFVVTGWIQVALAIGVMVRPRRWMLWIAGALSTAFVGAWAITRISGVPFGPNSGVAEPSAFIDVACVALEGAAVVLAAVAIWRPRFASGWSGQTLVFGSILPVAVIVLATSAVASPSASHHAHAGSGCPTGTKANPELASADGHMHDTSTCVPDIDDKGFSALGNGHHHAIVEHPLDPATQAELDRQLAITREVALLYPTVAAAEAAGYRRAGPYSPGLGAHYTHSGAAELNPDGVMTDETLRHPQSLQFTGNDPESEIAGYMYYSMSKIEPVGFPGTNDVWHYHSNVCIKVTPTGIDTPLGADRDDVTVEKCQAAGGFLLPTTQWMVHVWSLPGYENPSGVFAEESPHLGCSDGTYYTVADGETPLNTINNCVSGAPGNPLS